MEMRDISPSESMPARTPDPPGGRSSIHLLDASPSGPALFQTHRPSDSEVGPGTRYGKKLLEMCDVVVQKAPRIDSDSFIAARNIFGKRSCAGNSE
jgi:hypothetical protein